jgi:hypothetical protein
MNKTASQIAEEVLIKAAGATPQKAYNSLWNLARRLAYRPDAAATLAARIQKSPHAMQRATKHMSSATLEPGMKSHTTESLAQHLQDVRKQTKEFFTNPR